MATFPSLVPSTRLYIQGNYPSAIQASSSGVQTGFRQGNRRVNQVLELTFTSLTETEVNQIRTHYDGQNGSFELFLLSTSTWSGYASPPVPIISNFAWIYNTPPSISDSILTNRWDVELELKSVPIDIGDFIFDAGDSSSTARTYILDALDSSASPARSNIIDARNSL
tara:strand:- start:2521 stop:3024 length:504 start_codon:yes stop_codon:yes gene_type:complete